MTDTTDIKHPTQLTSGDFTFAEEPFALFAEWFAEACKSEPNDPNAMAQAIAMVAARHMIGEVPRPAGWSGWCVAPAQFEFWHDRPFRLHDRIEFRREAPDSAWTKTRLYP